MSSSNQVAPVSTSVVTNGGSQQQQQQQPPAGIAPIPQLDQTHISQSNQAYPQMSSSGSGPRTIQHGQPYVNQLSQGLALDGQPQLQAASQHQPVTYVQHSQQQVQPQQLYVQPAEAPPQYNYNQPAILPAGQPDYGHQQQHQPNYGQSGQYLHPPEGGFQSQQSSSTVIINQPETVTQNYGALSCYVKCPHCQVKANTSTRAVCGNHVWMIAGFICLIGMAIPLLWLGFCLIPFCIPELYDVRHQCPHCHAVLHEYKRSC